MTDEQWGPWIEHDGNGCPVSRGVIVATQHADGHFDEGPACGHDLSGWHWGNSCNHGFRHFCVIRYRIRKPRGLTILQEIAAHPDRVTVGA